MGRFVENQQYMRDVRTRVARGLNVNAQRAKPVVKALTPVLTSYAQRSVHAVVLNNGHPVMGDDTDDNGNVIPPYPGVAQHLTAVVGSNTEPRPLHEQFTGPGGYYLGLEMGIYSMKGSGMLAAGYTNMVAHVMDDIKDALA